MKPNQLETVSAVVDELGGSGVVAAMTRRKYVSAISNWRAGNSFPPTTYLVLKAALRAKGKSAPDELWGMEKAS